MENASKALIMAGTVLIAILLISIGILIFNKTKGVTKQVGDTATTTEIAMFNSKFTQYEGSNVAGVYVKSLLSDVRVSNAKNAEHAVTVKLRKINNTIATNPQASSIVKNFYSVICKYDSNGYVNEIQIREIS